MDYLLLLDTIFAIDYAFISYSQLLFPRQILLYSIAVRYEEYIS